MSDLQRMTLKRLAKLLKVLPLRNVSENAPSESYGEILNDLFLVVCSSFAWSSQFLVPSIVETVQVQHFCELLHPVVSKDLRSPGHRGEKPWSQVQLPGPHRRDCWAGLPSPDLSHLALRTPAYFSRKDLPLCTKDNSFAASIASVLSATHSLG